MPQVVQGQARGRGGDAKEAPAATNSLPSAKPRGAGGSVGRAAPAAGPAEAAHPLLVTVLKGHTGRVTALCVSSDARAVATASEDRTVRVYDCASLQGSAGGHRFARCQLDLDHAEAICFVGRSGRIACAMGGSKRIDVYAVDVPTAASAGARLPPPKQVNRVPCAGHTTSLRGLEVSAAAGAAHPVFVTTAARPDTWVRAWQPQGGEVARADTKQVENYCLAASADGRFLAVGAFSSDVKVFEIVRDKAGQATALHHACSLTAHSVRRVAALRARGVRVLLLTAPMPCRRRHRRRRCRAACWALPLRTTCPRCA